MTITLKPIDESNFLDAFHLQLRDDQTQYVSHRSAFTLMRGWGGTSW